MPTVFSRGLRPLKPFAKKSYATTGSVTFWVALLPLAKLGHNHHPLTTICIARPQKPHEREHLLNLGNALDYAPRCQRFCWYNC